MKKMVRLFHTIRHLRFRQIYGQIAVRLQRKIERRSVNAKKNLPLFVPGRENVHSPSLLPNTQNNTPQQLLEGKWTFINQEKDLGFPPHWSEKGLPKLWSYNLHYFDYLHLLRYEDAKRLVIDWMENVPLDRSIDPWEPYPTSLRLINWCHFFYKENRKKLLGDVFFEKRLRESILAQSLWLEKHLETHLLGNHYLENLACLACVGVFFAGPTAKRFVRKAKKELRKEIQEQILADGMHFERSPMYHCRMLELVVMMLDLPFQREGQSHRETADRMVSALRALVHPDGKIALLNDSAFGIYNDPEVLFESARKRNIEGDTSEAFGLFSLPEAGYYGSRTNDGHYIICDAGRVGPDYIPGHAHGDLFSFELSLRGERVIVDTGVYEYIHGPSRDYCRSTRAHNTVEIEGSDQCEFWDAFKMARRGYPREVSWKPTSDGFLLRGWHDGYQRLPGRPTHKRCFEWENSGGLRISDHVRSNRPVSGVARYHLHPDCSIEKIEDHIYCIKYPKGEIRTHFQGEGKVSIEETTYHPEFSLSLSNFAICYHFSGKDNLFTTVFHLI